MKPPRRFFAASREPAAPLANCAFAEVGSGKRRNVGAIRRRMAIIRLMRKTKNNPIEGVKDAAMGYTALVLSLLCFLCLLWVIIAVSRMLVG